MAKLAEVYLRILPGKFHYLKFILEGYDNLAILSSCTDASKGVVVVRYPQEMTGQLFGLLAELAPTLSGKI